MGTVRSVIGIDVNSDSPPGSDITPIMTQLVHY
jgi:hypothetical protein